MSNKENLIRAIEKLGIPPLYAQEHAAEPTIYLNLYIIGFDWSWHVFEANIEADDILFFGLVCGYEEELGYFRLSELESLLPYPIIIGKGRPMKFSKAKQKYGFSYKLSAEGDGK